jgi:hypothetical protein
MVYREASERRLEVESFMEDFKQQTGRRIEVMNPDTAAGQNFIEAYDIVEYPTLIAIGPDGTPAATWRAMLPTISQASAYN